MKTIIQEAQFFGPISTFCHYQNANSILLERHENYQKRSFRNRYNILTSNGISQLSIPLKKGKNNAQLITDVKIAYDENWTANHLQTIKSAYGKSAYFEFYFSDIENILKKKPAFLFDLNEEAICWSLKKLKLSTSLGHTVGFEKPDDIQNKKSVDVVDLRQNIDIKNINFVKYEQVWAEKFEFVSDLSILDLLFCTGPEASYYLKRMVAI